MPRDPPQADLLTDFDKDQPPTPSTPLTPSHEGQLGAGSQQPPLPPRVPATLDPYAGLDGAFSTYASDAPQVMGELKDDHDLLF